MIDNQIIDANQDSVPNGVQGRTFEGEIQKANCQLCRMQLLAMGCAQMWEYQELSELIFT